MRTQLTAYREEICRLHHANDTLAESNRILLDAMTTMRMEHAAGMQRLRGEMAPGFSWPDPDQSALVERYRTRVEELEAEARSPGCALKRLRRTQTTTYSRSDLRWRAPAPPVDAPESDTFYADQVLVAHPAVGESVAETERFPVGAPAAPPDQSPAMSHTPARDKAGTEAGPHGPVPPLAAGLRPDSRAAMARAPPLPRTATDPDHVPFYGRLWYI